MVIIIRENSFWGFITIGGRKYVFDISKPENSRDNEALLKIDWRLKKLLGSSLNNFLRGNDFNNPLHFYHQFEAFVKTTVITNNKTEIWLQNPLKTAALLKCLHQEIKNLTDYVKDFDIESGLLHIEVIDAQARSHKAVLKLSQNYKTEPITVINHDLPLQKNYILEYAPSLNNIFSVSEFCQKFIQLVNHFQQFWNLTALIDSQCWVLDPLCPTFKDIYRRIKLNDSISVVLMFNPFCCRQVPIIKLLGRQSDVNYYQSILQKNLEDELWDFDEDLMYNLSNVLEFSIPNKIYMEESEATDFVVSGECAICFTLKLHDNIPIEMCENSNCKSLYHSECLFMYLSSIPRNRNYFGKIQGECPNCEDIIFCTVPKLM